MIAKIVIEKIKELGDKNDIACHRAYQIIEKLDEDYEQIVSMTVCSLLQTLVDEKNYALRRQEELIKYGDMHLVIAEKNIIEKIQKDISEGTYKNSTCAKNAHVENEGN